VTPPTRSFLDRSVSVVEVSDFPWQIKPEDKIFFAGSCFASHLHGYWQDHFLPGKLSPFGNTYNPESLKETFSLLLSGRTIKEKELFFHQGLWRHSFFDTLQTHPEKEILLFSLNDRMERAGDFLRQCSYVIATVGTAWVYREDATGKTVNNCHKRPGGEFSRICLQAEEIGTILRDFHKGLSAFAPGIRFILTLSPVRHLRDRAEENSLSKALLRCALDRLVREQDDCVYFPSYEIMMDELRDYRWYADDLTHPSDQAVRYIMERFCDAAGSPQLKGYLKDAEKLGRQRNHRLLFPDSTEGRKFRENLRIQTEQFRQSYPFSVFPE
jgi:hypothetical protein